MTPAGWYHAENDPIGTIRYWNGTQWVGEAVQQPPAPPTAPNQPMPGQPMPGQPMPGQPIPSIGPRPASVGARVGGRVIDFILGTIVFAIFIATGIGGNDPSYVSGGSGYSLDLGFQRLDTGLEFLALGVFLLAFHTLSTHFFGGTPGKLLTGTRVADLETGATLIALPKAALRSANYLTFIVIGILISLEVAMTFVNFGIGLASFVLLFVDDRRTVMDRLAKTKVIKP